MLLRIGIVSWWLGAAIAALLVFIIAAGTVEHAPCASLLASQPKVDAESAANYAKFKRDHPDADPFTLSVAEGETLAGGPNYAEKLEACKRYEWPFLACFFGTLLVIALWSFTFIMGGSFWRPPKVRLLGAAPAQD